MSEERAIISTAARIVQERRNTYFRGCHSEACGECFLNESGNGKLDKGACGGPLKLCGFSNTARGSPSRQEIEKAAFIPDKADAAVSVTVKRYPFIYNQVSNLRAEDTTDESAM